MRFLQSHTRIRYLRISTRDWSRMLLLCWSSFPKENLACTLISDQLLTLINWINPWSWVLLSSFSQCRSSFGSTLDLWSIFLPSLGLDLNHQTTWMAENTRNTQNQLSAWWRKRIEGGRVEKGGREKGLVWAFQEGRSNFWHEIIFSWESLTLKDLI